MRQKTFWYSIGDLLKSDLEINTWLSQMEEQGFELFSRDQIAGEDGVWITYCLTKGEVGE